MGTHGPDVPTTIMTRRLLLHQYRVEDADLVMEAIEESRPELERWMPWAQYIHDAAQLRDEMPRNLERWANGEDHGYTIRRREDDRFLGSINYQNPNWEIPAFDLGYWMRSSETGKGYVSEAARALIQVAFRDLGAMRVQILCHDRNQRSRRVAEAVGGVLEGHTRNDSLLPDGELCGTVFYGLIRADEPVQRLLEDAPPT